MKKLKSAIALILALVMALSLAACGKGSETAKTTDSPGASSAPNSVDNAEHPDYVYSAQFKALDISTAHGISVYGGNDAGVYISWAEKVGEEIPEGAVPEYEGQYDVYEDRIGMIDYEGNIRTLENYKPLPRITDAEGRRDFSSYSGLNGIYPMADGRLLAVESLGSSWSDAPEGVDESSEEYWSYYQNTNEYYIRVLNADGSEVSTNKIAVEPGGYLNTYASAADASGNLVCSQDDKVAVIGTDGSISATISGGDIYIDRVVTLKDGTLAATTYGEQGMELLPIDIAGGKLGTAVALPNDAYNLYAGGGDYDLYYNSGINLYGYDAATGESTKLLNWMDCDINGDNMSGMSFGSDGRILVVINHWSYNRYSENDNGNTGEVAIVSKTPYDSAPQKTILTLAAQYISGSNLSEAIINFNRSNDKYRISVKDYSEYNTEDDYTAGLTKLNTEILAGNLPDMLILNGQMPYEQYAAKGILEDLYPYIDSDSEISREDFFPTVMSALEVDGKLCQAASSFGIQSVMGAKSVVGDTPGWTYEQYNAALATMPEGCSGFSRYMTRDDMLRNLLAADIGYYVNWTTGECSFDSPEFVNLLNFAAGFPAESPSDEEYVDDMTLISEGRQMLLNAYISNFDDVLYNDVYFGQNNSTYIGYPTNEGVGNTLSVNGGIAITKNCADKDGAWQFVRTFLTEKGQDEMYDYNMPTNMKLFDRYLEHEMTPEYEKDASGNFILDENGERIPVSKGGIGTADGHVYEIYAITQEQADNLRAVINSTTKLANYNDSIFDIVNEQAQVFFAGQKSAEEVAQLIQSKANIYVNEQR